MTNFIKENFKWDGEYLMYDGDQGEFNLTYGEAHGPERCHPTMIDKRIPMFIARFKHGSKPYKSWINFICKNFTIEEWKKLEATPEHEGKPQYGGMSPLSIMNSKGYLSPEQKKTCKAEGLAPSIKNFELAIKIETDRWMGKTA
jgi:hypothetical protein